MTRPIRCVGIAGDRGVITEAVVRAERLGLQTIGAATVAVAFDAAAVPPVGVARHDDGSFVVLDGETFPAAEPGAMAARVLAALRAGTLADVPFEGAVTWWDAGSGHTVVTADPVGAVPLAIGRVGATTVWSSEHRDLIAAGVAPEPDPHAIAMLAAMAAVPPPITYLRDASALAPGQRATIGADGAAVLSTWFVHTARPAGGEPVGDALVAAVGQRAAGASRLGAFLSAGIDSTAIAAVVRRALDLPLETFSFRYEGGDDEATYAAETARILGAPHTTITITPGDLRDRFSSIVDAFGSPVTFGVHSFKQDALREAGVDAVLTGADPGLWYDHGRSGAVASALWRLPAPVLAAMQSVRSPGAVFWSVMLANHGVKVEYLRPSRRRELVGRAAANGAARRGAAALEGFARDVASEEARHRATFVGARVRVNAAEWNTRWARAFRYPIRAPFFDVRVCRAITRRRPWDQHEKSALRAYTATLLPADRAHTPKVFQELPIGAWLRGPLRDLVHDVLAPERVARAGIVEDAPLRRLLAEHERGIDHKWPLWQLMTAVEWACGLRDGVAPADVLVPPR